MLAFLYKYGSGSGSGSGPKYDTEAEAEDEDEEIGRPVKVSTRALISLVVGLEAEDDDNETHVPHVGLLSFQLPSPKSASNTGFEHMTGNSEILNIFCFVAF